MRHQNLFVFDIETVPDDSAAFNLTGLKSDDVQECRKAIEQYHLDITDGKNSFPRQPFHKIVAISFVEAEIERDSSNESYKLKQVRSGGKMEADEKELVSGFFQYLERNKPRLVSFNGRGFDLPVLKFRAMKHGISAPWLYLSGDKWNSYTSRYSPDWHCDLLDTLSDYGAATRGLKLNEMCSILGFPGKVGVDGSKVAPMYDEGDIEGIRNYCETDVMNTFLVYLAQQRHLGVVTNNDYEHSIQEIIKYLEIESQSHSHWDEFYKAWQESDPSLFA